jgi:hypothetical protein
MGQTGFGRMKSFIFLVLFFSQTFKCGYSIRIILQEDIFYKEYKLNDAK